MIHSSDVGERPSNDPATEVGLFVIWARARHLQDRILADLGRRFSICAVHEMRWTHKFATANFQRFYSDLELRGVYHRLNKGDGTFLVITVVDHAAVMDFRKTGRGRRRVLARFMDAKSCYREWSGGIGIHCGETAWETERDLCMLLGLDYLKSVLAEAPQWDGSIKQKHRDLTGAVAWQSIDELFGVLNRATNYVAIHYDDGKLDLAAARDENVDFLAEDYYALHTILNNGRYMRTKPRNGGRIPVRIGEQMIGVALRFPGDNYFDESWARELLASRVLDPAGYYRPASEENFWLLAYHALVHQPELGEKTRHRLLAMAKARGLVEWQRCLQDGPDAGRSRMLALFEERGIGCPEPLDPAVSGRRGDGGSRSTVPHSVARLRNGMLRIGEKLWNLTQTMYWPIRDGLLVRAPWLNKVKHWRRLLT